MIQTSFRDPDGQLVATGGRLFRCVGPHAAPTTTRFLASEVCRRWEQQGLLAKTKRADPDSLPSDLALALRRGAQVWEHEPVWFPSFPYEWPPEMLHAAGALTLKLARGARSAGFRLKDATPYNVLFEGARPVFVDLLSFDQGDPLDPLWHGYAQFVKAFVYPLLAAKHGGLRLDELLLVHRDGIEPERIQQLLPWWRRWMPPLAGAVTLPALLASRGKAAAAGTPRQAREPGEAEFLVSRTFARAERLLAAAEPDENLEQDDDYARQGHPYSEAERARKDEAVKQMLEAQAPRAVLDVGCHRGRYSIVAARLGARVVSVDARPEVVGSLWRTASRQGLDILPLAIDIARPPGGCGWRNREWAGFVDRARGRVDCVMMLAVIHHLLVTERVPLDEIVDLAADLTTGEAIIEYVDPRDRQFQTIARGREALYTSLDQTVFESSATRRFTIVAQTELSPTRRLYRLRKGRR